MINGKKVLAITLARAGSTSVPHKNRRQLNGVPLIEYTIEAALGSKYIDFYCVSTDDPIIGNITRAYGVTKMDRSPELANDTAKSADALIEAALKCSKEAPGFRRYVPYDYVVELMATNPFKTAEDIDRCIEMLDESEDDVPSVIAITKENNAHPRRLKTLGSNNTLMSVWEEPPEARRQDMTPDVYLRCGAIYAVRTEYLMENKKRYEDGKSRGYIMEGPSVNIDTEEDFKLASLLL